MRRIMLLMVVAAMMAVMMVVFAGPASAQGGGCAAFGQNVASLGTTLGPTFGQNASSTAPLNTLVESEQDALCSSD